MDMSSTTAPNSNYELVKVYREAFMKYYIEDPKYPDNEEVHETMGALFVLGNYLVIYEEAPYLDYEGNDDQCLGYRHEKDNTLE